MQTKVSTVTSLSAIKTTIVEHRFEWALKIVI